MYANAVESDGPCPGPRCRCRISRIRFILRRQDFDLLGELPDLLLQVLPTLRAASTAPSSPRPVSPAAPAG